MLKYAWTNSRCMPLPFSQCKNPRQAEKLKKLTDSVDETGDGAKSQWSILGGWEWTLSTFIRDFAQTERLHRWGIWQFPWWESGQSGHWSHGNMRISQRATGVSHWITRSGHGGWMLKNSAHGVPYVHPKVIGQILFLGFLSAFRSWESQIFFELSSI